MWKRAPSRNSFENLCKSIWSTYTCSSVPFSIFQKRSFHNNRLILETWKENGVETGKVIDRNTQPSFRFDKLLVANRGEIACRVFRTAKKLGLKTVAIYSDADRNSLHVDWADEAIRIGPPPSTESYLNMDNIIRAAKQVGAQVIHPGYGFLSENSIFAEKCRQNGILFVGPPVEAIKKMGSKAAARSIMQAAGVPVVPGYHGDDQSDKRLLEEAKRIGFPVMIKPSMGGGGKGMKIVHSESEFLSLLEASRAEASSSFGDTHILLEKYLAVSRHVEVQIVADKHGNCVHLYERDCSVQRRHQKIIEEAPAPGISSSLRSLLGTVEFILDATRLESYNEQLSSKQDWKTNPPFYFMEMNTRLQVEHPVTEMITGQDLVEWQLRVTNEEYLPILHQQQIPLSGHAMEVRIYAENPFDQFLPQAGTIHKLIYPPTRQSFSSNPSVPIRIDSGMKEGDMVGVFYDPMIAKLIVSGQSREEVRQRLVDALFHTRVFGIPTNIEFVQRILRLEEFAMTGIDTGFLERNMEDLTMPLPGWVVRHCAVCASVAQFLFDSYVQYSRQSADPWCLPALSLFRLHLEQRYSMDLIPDKFSTAAEKDKEIHVQLTRLESSEASELLFLAKLKEHQALVRILERQVILDERDDVAVKAGTKASADYMIKMKLEWKLPQDTETDMRSQPDVGTSFREWIDVYQVGSEVVVYREGLSSLNKSMTTGYKELTDSSAIVARFKRSKSMLAFERGDSLETSSPLSHGAVQSPMPGRVAKVLATVGQQVNKGDPILVLEAMKMTHQILSPIAGCVKEIHFGPNDLVSGEAMLFEIQPDVEEQTTNLENKA
ncbi:Methylcrotonoyl-CoA carboxylase subunit alpha, mitochondrial [Galdieria sulphuraria]|nr:Methylcrotonoyl-CoA carboxylase subunit alpha, mitochondrial [Galdieria sulphuraria]